jgi:RND family efflux transporter MFP subunit
MIPRLKKALGAGLLAAALGCFALPATAQAQLSSAYSNPIPGVTTPPKPQYSRLTLPMAGPVLELPVKPGQEVKKGQLLLRQDDRIEQAKLKGLELEANSTARVDEAKANLEVKKSILARKEQTYKNHALSAQEYEEAKLDEIDAEARLKVAQLDLAKAKTDVEAEEAKIQQMELTAQFDGIVADVNVSVGEVTDPTKPMITVVQNDPLWVEVRNMPTVWAARLTIGEKVDVRYDDRYAGTPIYDQAWTSATVIYKSPVADEGSDTQLVRLSMPNPKHLDSGLQVMVKLPDAVVAQPASPSASAQ